ncbi:MAG: hypothetical protein H0X30_38590 [Anaerolineae bacterium]|nr:hypothetical protein [Anaerolineae bacterium]
MSEWFQVQVERIGGSGGGIANAISPDLIRKILQILQIQKGFFRSL